MHQSSWDLEVHAREMQQRWLREAERARQIAAARQRGDRPRVSAPRFSISRLLTAFRNTLSPQRNASAGAAAPSPAGPALPPLPLAEPQLSPDARPGGLSQPYAGMVVLARGTSAPTAPADRMPDKHGQENVACTGDARP